MPFHRNGFSIRSKFKVSKIFSACCLGYLPIVYYILIFGRFSALTLEHWIILVVCITLNIDVGLYPDRFSICFLRVGKLLVKNTFFFLPIYICQIYPITGTCILNLFYLMSLLQFQLLCLASGVDLVYYQSFNGVSYRDRFSICLGKKLIFNYFFHLLLFHTLQRDVRSLLHQSAYLLNLYYLMPHLLMQIHCLACGVDRSRFRKIRNYEFTTKWVLCVCTFCCYLLGFGYRYFLTVNIMCYFIFKQTTLGPIILLHKTLISASVLYPDRPVFGHLKLKLIRKIFELYLMHE